MKKRLFYILLFIIPVFMTLLFLEGALRLISLNKEMEMYLVDYPERKTGLFEYDKELGWKQRPNFDKYWTWPYATTREKINSQGFRDREYPFEKSEDVFRIAVIGCSRTYGYGVNLGQTYTKQLERLLNNHYSKKIEVINFGVNGYGLSQMTLNYGKNVRKYHPDLVFLQVYKETMYRADQTNLWATQKPAYELNNGKLALINMPIPENRFHSFERWFIDHSLLYKFIKQHLLEVEEIFRRQERENIENNVELYHLSSQIIRYLNDQIGQDDSQLIVFSWGSDTVWIQSIFENADVEYFVLEDYSDRSHWENKGDLENPPPTGHWSPLGHQWVAEAIFNYLQKNLKSEIEI